MNSGRSPNPRKMDLAAVSIIIALGAIAWYGQIAPIHAGHDAAQARQTLLAEQKARARDLERSVRSITDQLAATRKAAEGSKLTLEPAGELNQRLARLTELAIDGKLQVDSIESGATTSIDRYATVAVRLTGRGTYRNCATALRQLRSAMPDIGVVSFQLTSPAVTPDTTASFVFELLWYTQPQPKNTGK